MNLGYQSEGNESKQPPTVGNSETTWNISKKELRQYKTLSVILYETYLGMIKVTDIKT